MDSCSAPWLAMHISGTSWTKAGWDSGWRLLSTERVLHFVGALFLSRGSTCTDAVLLTAQDGCLDGMLGYQPGAWGAWCGEKRIKCMC